MSAPPNIEDRDGILWITLTGELTKEGGEEYRVALEKYLDGVSRLASVCVDLRDLTGCSVFARSELITAQRLLKDLGARTCYLASRPRIRGLGLWVGHISEDENAKSVITLEKAKEWWDSSLGREESARQALMSRGRLR